MPVPTDRTSTPARRFAAIEPFAGQVYFSPECHERYAALGFSRAPARPAAWRCPTVRPTSAAGARSWARCRASRRRRLRRLQPGGRGAHGRQRVGADRRRNHLRGPRRGGHRPARAHPRRRTGRHGTAPRELLQRADAPLRPEGGRCTPGSLARAARATAGRPGGSPTSSASTGVTPLAAWTCAGFEPPRSACSPSSLGPAAAHLHATRAWSDDELDAARRAGSSSGGCIGDDGALTDEGRAGARRSRRRPTGSADHRRGAGRRRRRAVRHPRAVGRGDPLRRRLPGVEPPRCGRPGAGRIRLTRSPRTSG